MIIRIVVSGRVKSAVVTSRNDITHCRLSQQRKTIVKYYYYYINIPRAGAASEALLRGKMIFHRFWLHNSCRHVRPIKRVPLNSKYARGCRFPQTVLYYTRDF